MTEPSEKSLRRARNIPFFCAAVLASALLAAHQAEAATTTLPEEVVVSSPVYDAEDDKYLSPGSVTVIRPEAKAGEQRTLPDLLEEVPGLRVIRLQGRHGYAVASVRGSTSSQVAVYVDGILMNLQSESAVDLSSIPVDNVERIEVYKGYVPARFGAQAMGGVINIMTKTPEEPDIRFSAGVGSFGRYKGGISYGAPLAGGKFFASFGYESYEGDFGYTHENLTYVQGDEYAARRRDNGFENTDLLLKWNDSRWKARASWVRRNRELALYGPGMDRKGEYQPPGPLLDTDRWDLSLGRSFRSGPVDWGIDVKYTRQDKYYDSRRGGGNSLISHFDVDNSEYNTTRAGVSVNAEWVMSERHYLEFLGEYSDERLHVDGDVRYKYMGGIENYGQTDWDFNLQDTIALDRAGTFLANPSIRWHKQDGEDHLTWQIALTKEFSSEWILKSAYGTYARAPNTYERYGDGAFILPAKESLKWETGTQFDLGVIWSKRTPNDGVSSRVSLAAFWRESDNLIEFDMESPAFARYENVAEAKVKGVEIETMFDWKRWSLTMSGTWLDGTNETPEPGSVRSVGLRLPNRPEWSGIARLTHRFTGLGGEGGDGSVFIEHQYTGENFVDTSETVVFDMRSVWNAGVKYDLSATTHLTVGVDDIFDSADEWKMRPSGGLNGPIRKLWYPVEGRSYYLTLDVEL
jgi:outer membrane cobalamin receptor